MAMTRIKYKLANKRAEQEIGILLNMNRRKTQYRILERLTDQLKDEMD